MFAYKRMCVWIQILTSILSLKSAVLSNGTDRCVAVLVYICVQTIPVTTYDRQKLYSHFGHTQTLVYDFKMKFYIRKILELTLNIHCHSIFYLCRSYININIFKISWFPLEVLLFSKLDCNWRILTLFEARNVHPLEAWKI